MEQFVDNDHGYTTWLVANPGGLVVNRMRSLGAAAGTVHRASCRTIRGTPAAGQTWTGGQYIKRCYADEHAFATATASELAKLVACRICKPAINVGKIMTVAPSGSPAPKASVAPTNAAMRPAKSATHHLGQSAPTIIAAKATPVRPWPLWGRGEFLAECPDLTPLLASWEKKSHPAQIKLQAYLDYVQGRLGTIIAGQTELFLQLSVDVVKPERLTRHYDVENYLTPIIDRLGAHHFVLVDGEKHVGGGSRIVVGRAVPELMQLSSWQHYSCRVSTSITSTAGKDSIRQALIDAGVAQLSDGQVEVRIGFRCAATIGWSDLWKATGDAMGPLLGPEATRDWEYKRRFTPHDDRIVSLQLHRDLDAAMTKEIEVGFWWRLRDGHGLVHDGAPDMTVVH